MLATPTLPPRLAIEAERRVSELAQALPDLMVRLERLEKGPQRCAELARLLATSPFCAQLLQRRPELLWELLDSGALDRALSTEDLERAWQSELDNRRSSNRSGDSLPGLDAERAVDLLDRCLRRLRNRHYLRLIWRDFCGHATMEQTAAEMALLARWCIQRALDVHYHALCVEWGTPVGLDGQPQQLVVLGMGKLGANELNLSSDVDLIFAYPGPGETQGGAAA